jgi:hypothetical protein
MHRDFQRLSALPELAKTMFVERPILAAVRRDECARQRIWSKPSSQRFTVQAVGGISHPEAGLVCVAGFNRPRVVAWLLRHLVVSVPIHSAIYVTAAILWFCRVT